MQRLTRLDEEIVMMTTMMMTINVPYIFGSFTLLNVLVRDKESYMLDFKASYTSIFGIIRRKERKGERKRGTEGAKEKEAVRNWRRGKEMRKKLLLNCALFYRV